MAQCICPTPAGGKDFGQGWRVADDWSAMTCSRCGGEPRPEQDRQMAGEWIEGMRLHAPIAWAPSALRGDD